MNHVGSLFPLKGSWQACKVYYYYLSRRIQLSRQNSARCAAPRPIIKSVFDGRFSLLHMHAVPWILEIKQD